MNENSITEPLLNTSSEFIVEENVLRNELLRKSILEDIRNMSDETRSSIVSAMFRMHKYFEEECGDLDVSLSSESEILENTESWYVILDNSSTPNSRVVRYHYKANWETSHGVEVIVINGDNLIFVGNCGYVKSPEKDLSFPEEGFNFVPNA